MAPNFDDIPASATPNRSVTSAYHLSQRDQGTRSVSPVLSERTIPTIGASTVRSAETRPSLDSPYTYAKRQWHADRDADMSNNARAHNDRREQELPPLQINSNLESEELRGYVPVDADEDDPTSFDLVAPGAPEKPPNSKYNLEIQSQALFSKEHLQVIFSDPGYLLRFTSFLGLHRPRSVPVLVHYLDSLKALRALHYANAILEGLDTVPGLDFTKEPVTPTTNPALLARANAAFDQLVKDELPAFVTHEYVQIVSQSIAARITGMLAPHLREASEGLAEVFCLTDPSRPDNPIVFASEDFNRTTQYGLSYVLGRNCRFLQGPCTNPLSVRRFRMATGSDKATPTSPHSHSEVFLNYRRDGSPFMNLLMVAPLTDSRGTVRYYIGAQVDVSGLVKECYGMESLAELLRLQGKGEPVPDHQLPDPKKSDELRELSEMLNHNELTTIRRHGGKMHREVSSDSDDEESSIVSNQPRLVLKDPNTLTPPLDSVGGAGTDADYMSGAGSVASVASLTHRLSGKLSGVYHNYLLLRPYPSLRILFASPSQRVPGILQSPFMNKIGGSNRVREELTAALAEGRGVTAKVRWVTRHDDPSGGRNKWIHCTPLIGVEGKIGVWMVVIVDDERHRSERQRVGGGGMGRGPPPVMLGESYGRGSPAGHRGSRQGSRDVNSYGSSDNAQPPLPDRSVNRRQDTDEPMERGRRDSLRGGGEGSVNSFGL